MEHFLHPDPDPDLTQLFSPSHFVAKAFSRASSIAII